jgi:uncharacterized protein (TIGR02757 family)
MDDAPHQFCLAYDEAGLKRLLSFRHRTFNTTDLLYFVHFLHHHYSGHQSLESAFSQWVKPGDDTIENALTGFHRYFFSLEDAPSRTKKHVATPERGSTCKRLCMFLRWMVRRDNCGVDFGIWQTISPAQLVCPVDLHVARVARQLGLITRKQTDWLTALELTRKLKLMDPHDPAKYDFALFGLGVMKAPAPPNPSQRGGTATARASLVRELLDSVPVFTVSFLNASEARRQRGKRQLSVNLCVPLSLWFKEKLHMGVNAGIA